ncbi:aspartyl/asparaginyl beta-hydroxylase domain-containing protein [Aquimarina rubra]|uniref:Aspartyl/asparaginyl beta-hydroxylase domain-containing protein n=1 Tax=Aquimarina rubra TaxID=1920033 RepID=A0ABW5LBE9_9FLAO
MSVATIPTSDRIKLPYTFDAEKMLEEFKAFTPEHFEYYDVIPLRAPAHQVDTSLPFPPPADDYADGSWTDWLDTKALQQSPYLTGVVDFFRAHTKVTLVRLLRLAPGAIVKEHTDPTLGLEIERSVIRLTIPITYSDDVVFYLNNTPVSMLPGECWYLRLTDPHKIDNLGNTERVNFTIDMIPNDWVRTTIIENDAHNH